MTAGNAGVCRSRLPGRIFTYAAPTTVTKCGHMIKVWECLYNWLHRVMQYGMWLIARFILKSIDIQALHRKLTPSDKNLVTMLCWKGIETKRLSNFLCKLVNWSNKELFDKQERTHCVTQVGWCLLRAMRKPWIQHVAKQFSRCWTILKLL